MSSEEKNTLFLRETVKTLLLRQAGAETETERKRVNLNTGSKDRVEIS